MLVHLFIYCIFTWADPENFVRGGVLRTVLFSLSPVRTSLDPTGPMASRGGSYQYF